MAQIEERYISLLTDFGFKRIFGTKPNKDLLIDFLNSLFDGEQVITDVRFLNSEHVGDVYAERKAIFDVYCENEHGEKFIVEMQNAFQQFFKDRSLYYSTYPIREQAPKGMSWDFQLKTVYTIAILNFDLREPAFDERDINHDVALMDIKTHRIFSAKLRYKYVEVAKFDKTEDELATPYEKWLFVLKNLSRLDKRPASLKEKIFHKLFDEAQIARFTPKELHEYEDSLKAYRDIQNSIDTALRDGIEKGRADGLRIGMEQGLAQGREQGLAQGRELGLAQGRELGLAQGREQGRIEAMASLVRNMLGNGMTVEQVARLTQLTEDEVMQIGEK